MALDTVEAARQGITLLEFDRRAMLMPLKAGAGYLDRQHVLEQLVQARVVRINERVLGLGQLDGIDWVESGLRSGNQLTWQIAQIVDGRGRFLRKFDSDHLAQIGLVGEKAVVDLLHKALPDSKRVGVRHVSLIDDSLGYDISAPSISGMEGPQLIEVKTSVRPGPNFILFLSRNEFRIGSNNPNWSLVCVRVIDDQPQVLGFLPMNRISDRFPKEEDEAVTWASCRVVLSTDVLTPGLP